MKRVVAEKERMRTGNSFSLRSVLILVLLIVLKTRLSRIMHFEGNLSLARVVRMAADECQTLGLTVVGSVLFFLGSILEAESTRVRNSVSGA